MNLSRPFVRRPIGTVLLTIGVALAGIAGFFALPVSPLPQVDFPVISVSASIPGASPDTMATSVATPLERHLGTIAGVNEITSSSSTGSTRVTLQFDLSRNIDGAAREVQAAINASRVDLPATLRSNPTYREANPAAAPVIILALTEITGKSTCGSGETGSAKKPAMPASATPTVSSTVPIGRRTNGSERFTRDPSP